MKMCDGKSCGIANAKGSVKCATKQGDGVVGDDTNGVKFVGWSQSDRKDSEYLAELSKQIKSCLPVVKSPMRKRNEEEFSPLHVKSGYINGMYHEANAKNTTTKLTRRQL